ncbi:phage tail tape measure protein [Pigmentiphaga sp. YJ18]|uniref:phage tail tape measure protein n=1 Tax=Pigmentiphaga sp. YJ18 TaxID=3134907 RepID=UPI00310E2B7D
MNQTNVRLGADASGYILELARAGKSADAWAASNEAAARRTAAAQAAVAEATQNGSNASTAAINRFMRSLTQQASTAGLTRAELLRLQAAQMGVTNQAAPFIAQIEAAQSSMQRAAGQSSALRAGLDRITGGASSAAARLGELTANLSPLATAFVGVGVGVPVLAGLETAAYRAVRGMVEVQAQVDKITIGLKFINGGNLVAAGEDMGYLRDMANRLGLDVAQTTQDFIGLAAASRGTSLEGERTRDIFTAVSEASTVLHLSAGETSGALTAIQQMMSKGTVQAEELRGQLGERLPGAFQIAARAMGVTTEELSKMLEQGQVIATDFLPKFAAQLRKEFSGSVEEASASAQAALGRSGTAWTDLKQTMVDSGLGEFAAQQMNILTDGINGITQAMRRAREEGSGFWGQMASGAGALLRFMNPANAVDYTPQSDRERVKYLQGELDRYQAAADRGDRGAKNRVRQVTREMQEINGRLTPANSVGDFEAYQARMAEAEARDRKALQDRANAFISGGKHRTGQEQYRDNLKAIDDQFAAAVAGLEKGSELYNQALAVATARKAELTEKFNKAGRTSQTKADRLELSGQLEALQQQYRDQEGALRDHLADIRAQQQLGVISAREALDQELAARQQALAAQKGLLQQQAELNKGPAQIKARERYEGELRRVNAAIERAQKDHANALAQLNRQEAMQVQAFNDSLLNAVETRRKAVDAQVAALGLGANAREQQERLAQVYREVDSKRYDLGRSRTENRISELVYQEELAALQRFQEQRVAQELDATARMRAAETDWRTGAQRGIADFIDASNNQAAQSAALVTGVLGNTVSAIASFATTGKGSIKDLAITFIAEVVRMKAAAAAAGFMSWLMPIVSGALGGGGAAGGAAADSAINTAVPSLTAVAAHGKVFDGGRTVAFAKGAAFTNSIVSVPTTFPMADGNRGMMGEAGPEAAVPLVRTASGDLGVRVAGGAGGGDLHIETSVHVTTSGGGSDRAGGSETMARGLGDQINQWLMDGLQQQMLPGGLLWKWKQGYG